MDVDENRGFSMVKRYSKNHFKTMFVNRLKTGSRLKNLQTHFNNQPDVTKEAQLLQPSGAFICSADKLLDHTKLQRTTK